MRLIFISKSPYIINHKYETIIISTNKDTQLNK